MDLDVDAPRLDIGLAFAGSILMFIGWVLALVPAFRLKTHPEIVVPLVIAVIAFGVVLIPAGLQFLGEPGRRRGVSVVFASLVPAALLFILVVVFFPLQPGFRALAIVAEFLGLAGYGWAFYNYGRDTSSRQSRL
ncbi:MAG TPA: hypothetical protein VFB58_07565 [Chloroflexota bacterium]|nr:hypothetical protein [Chloroflexota bacterium]